MSLNQKPRHVEEPWQLTLYGHEVETTRTLTYLGLVIDQAVSWRPAVITSTASGVSQTPTGALPLHDAAAVFGIFYSYPFSPKDS